MPAASEPPALVALPHTWRPLGVRIAAVVLGGGLLAVCALAWIGFDDETQARFTIFQRGTLAALGLLVFGLFYALVRSRVVAEESRVVVVNGYRRTGLRVGRDRRDPPAPGRPVGDPRPG